MDLTIFMTEINILAAWDRMAVLFAVVSLYGFTNIVMNVTNMAKTDMADSLGKGSMMYV